MNTYEQFKREPGNERLLSPEAVAIEEASEKTRAVLETLLHERHEDKLYHDPLHSISETEQDFSSVTERVKMLSDLMRGSFENAIADAPQDHDAKMLFFRALEDGARAHDTVINVRVLDSGMIERVRGWQAGGNERESFEEFKREFLKRCQASANPLVESYLKTVEEAIHGTLPDASVFGYQIPEDFIRQYPEHVQACLRSENAAGETEYKGLMLDATKTNESLPALITSTADLGDAMLPERFKETGNKEFFELNFGIARDCAAYLAGAPIPRVRARAILASMAGWRKVQVGVAVCQRLRLLEKYTKETISDLFEKSFSIVPDEAEVEEFLEALEPRFDAIDETIVAAADAHDTFVAEFGGVIAAEGEPTLTVSEADTFLSAVAFMDGDHDKLERYVAHVETEIEPVLPYKLAA